MGYERDPDQRLKGVGTIAAHAGVRPRADLRRRQRAANSLRNRDRMMAAMTYGPNGGLQGLGMVKIPTFGRTGFKEAPVVTSGGVVEGAGTIGGGGAVNVGGTFGSGGGGGGVSPTNTGGVRGKVVNLGLSSITGKIVQMSPPAYVGICVDASGNKIACPPPPGKGWNPGTGIVPPNYTPPSSGSITPVPLPPVQANGTIGGGGGGGAGIDTNPGPVPIDPLPPPNLDEVSATGMSTNQKIAIGVGAVALAYLLFKKGA